MAAKYLRCNNCGNMKEDDAIRRCNVCGFIYCDSCSNIGWGYRCPNCEEHYSNSTVIGYIGQP